MEVLCVEHVAMGRVVLSGINRAQKTVNVLHVRHVTTKSDHSGIAKSSETFNIGETSERTV